MKNPGKAYEELKYTINKIGAEAYITSINSVYDQVARRIDAFKTDAIINFAGFLLAILILATLVKIDRESYFHDQGRRIDVSRLLGYNFLSIHKKKILWGIFFSLMGIALLFAVIFVTYMFSGVGFFVPRGGWTLSKLSIVLLISVIALLICNTVEIVQLKHSERNIGTRLKEG